MSTEPQISVLPHATEPAEEGVDLFAIVVALLQEWRLALVTTFLIAALLIAYIFTLKPEFVAKVSFVPKDTRDTSGVAGLFSSRSPDALYLGLLSSRTLQQDVIDRVNLMPVFHAANAESARDQLLGKTSVEEAATTIVSVSVRDGDAQLAARIANAYLESLQDVIDQMSLQPSQRTTSFFEQQLSLERVELAKAENDLAQTERSTGVVSPEAQNQIGLSTIAGLRSQITDTQVRLSALLESETEQNPEVVRLRSTLGALEAKERAIEGSGSTPVGAAPSASAMPSTTLDIDRAQRTVRYHEQLVNSLASQYEAAKLNQTFTRPAFQIVDRAIAPEHKAWPPRRPYLMAAVAFAAFMGVLAVLAKLVWRRIQSSPGYEEKMASLRRSFRRV